VPQRRQVGRAVDTVEEEAPVDLDGVTGAHRRVIGGDPVHAQRRLATPENADAVVRPAEQELLA
jgi:hypothetical protein